MKAHLDSIVEMGTPLLITRPHGNDMVIMTKDEYDRIQETFHLIKSPKNAERLLDAIQNEKDGKGAVVKLLD